MMNPMLSAELLRKIDGLFEVQESFYQDFLGKGKNYTEGYLSSFGTLRKFLAKNYLISEGCRYNGARKALEEMAKNS